MSRPRLMTHTGLVCLLALYGASNVVGQGGARPPRPSPAIRSLESKAQEAQSAYVTQMRDLATGYEDAGQMEQAEETLKLILKVTPNDDEIKTKLKDLNEKVFNDNQKEVDVEAAKGWTATGLRVTKGQPIRVEAQGTYKFIVNADVGPDGFPTKDVARDMGEGIATGALMGTVFSESTQRNKPPQAGKPFQVGIGGEIKPDADGILFLRLNVPANSKCIGKVKVTVTGNIAPSR
ncbi:MAG: hypothetical protein ACK5Q5_06680 [Planctomycetaceae bacterium]